MPKKTNEEIEKIEEKPVKKAVRSKNITAEEKPAKKSTSKIASIKETIEKKGASKGTSAKKVSAKEKVVKDTSNKTSDKKTSTKKSSTKETESAKKKSSTSSKTGKKSTEKKAPSKEVENKKVKKTNSHYEVLEYYDLPYRYNQTVVKILAQTPTTLFVYWDISDEDKEQYIKQYGQYFFNNTKPVLVIHNKTLNYSFEIDINDFANCWYLYVNDSNCNYQVELGRRPINQYVNISNNYLHIVDSNDYITQNDHILFDKLSHLVYFKNVKTNEIIVKDIANFILLQKIAKLDIKKFYERLYPEEILNFEKFHLGNPSSSH